MRRSPPPLPTVTRKDLERNGPSCLPASSTTPPTLDAAFASGLTHVGDNWERLVSHPQVDIIVEAFIVVVIGGLGSFWGTFLGAIVFGQVLAFGILILPGFSIFAVAALMALVLVLRPSGLLGRAVKR